MRQCGANKTTEFTRKQINVLYFKAKKGELNIEKWMISKLYDLSEYCGYDDNKSIEQDERTILNILDLMFANDLANAQELINDFTESYFNRLSKKNQIKCDRNFQK